MGLIRRNRSGKYIGGSKLNVPGQGIYTVVRQPNDKESIKSQIERLPRPTPTPSQIIAPECDITLTIILPTPTPTPTITLTSTPTPTPSSTPIEICYLATEDLIILGAENGDNLLTECI